MIDLKEQGAECVGIDGCKVGWLCLTRDPRTRVVRCRVVEKLADLFAADTPKVVAIDIPIGLPDTGARRCDREARAWIQPRGSSVFPAPLRPMMTATSYEEACSIGRRIHGKAITKQAWAIFPKIREVDDLLSEDPGVGSTLYEVHPEVCFRAWCGSPMNASKKKKTGRHERQNLISAHFGIDAYGHVRNEYLVKDVAHDDILDAFAALWTAERIVRNQHRYLPKQEETDSTGLPMRIAY